jgi:hypothetical protein
MAGVNLTIPDDLSPVSAYNDTHYVVIAADGADPLKIKAADMFTQSAQALTDLVETLQHSYDQLSALVGTMTPPVVVPKQFSQADLNSTNHLVWVHNKGSVNAIPTLFDNTGLQQLTEGIFHVNSDDQITLDLNDTISGNWLLVVQFYNL